MLKLMEEHYNNGVSNPQLVEMVYNFYEKAIRGMDGTSSGWGAGTSSGWDAGTSSGWDAGTSSGWGAGTSSGWGAGTLWSRIARHMLYHTGNEDVLRTRRYNRSEIAPGSSPYTTAH